jgi:hypothetical protein
MERCDAAVVDALEENDILFIDSSHMIRPQGDVLTEVLEWLGRLRPGVLVHFHDIFTPRDYPLDLLMLHRFFWNEQYSGTNNTWWRPSSPSMTASASCCR